MEGDREEGDGQILAKSDPGGEGKVGGKGEGACAHLLAVSVGAEMIYVGLSTASGGSAVNWAAAAALRRQWDGVAWPGTLSGVRASFG